MIPKVIQKPLSITLTLSHHPIPSIPDRRVIHWRLEKPANRPTLNLDDKSTMNNNLSRDNIKKLTLAWMQATRERGLSYNSSKVLILDIYATMQENKQINTLMHSNFKRAKKKCHNNAQLQWRKNYHSNSPLKEYSTRSIKYKSRINSTRDKKIVTSGHKSQIKEWTGNVILTQSTINVSFITSTNEGNTKLLIISP